MIIGIPKEIKNHEYRTGLVPAGVRELVANGHNVIVEKSAGEGSGITDEEYRKAGALIRDTATHIFSEANMVVKVKEPLPQEYKLLRENQILFTYLHLAPSFELTSALLKAKTIGIAYETIQSEDGLLPLLTPMSEIAGKLAVQFGAYFLQKNHGGSGILMGGVPGTDVAHVTILGGGVVGTNATKVAVGMGASVTILDTNVNRLRYLSDIFGNHIITLASNMYNLERAICSSDLVIGGVLIIGAKAPCIVSKNIIATMKKGSVVVDVAIDQGGCIETSRTTSLDHPCFTEQGVIHCCVPNMPSTVASTATFALTNATLPYIVKIANMGYEKAIRSDKSLFKGLNVFKGMLTNKPVADSLNLEYTSPETLFPGK